MASAYENIRKLNSLLHTPSPLTEQKRTELARLRHLVQVQLVQAEHFPGLPFEASSQPPSDANSPAYSQPELAF